MLIEEPESYIERIQRLASGNQLLQVQLDELMVRIATIELQNKKYQEALLKYSHDAGEGSKAARKSAKRLRMVSVLYVSVQGFEKVCQLEDTSPLIDMLDELYLVLEEIAFKYNVVKIKAVGDQMLFAAGLQGEKRTNPVDIVKVALEMQQAAYGFKTASGENFWELKLGIHTGPVLAVPGGQSSNSYNFAGETINIACRMGEATPGSSLSISAMAFELVKEFVAGEIIGKMPVRYKGNLSMYKISGYTPELQSETSPFVPNKKYADRYLTLKFMDIQEELLDYLETKLPSNLFYHNVKHTIDVVTEVELIGWAEGVSEEEILLLKLAALFHDAGHTISYQDHEYHSTVMAREKLASYDFTPEQIEIVCRLIMATKMPPDPKDILEAIMCDSDLDYLGRVDFIPVSNTLYKELKEYQMVGTWREWNKLQLKFISNHQYFTKTAQQLREINKNSQMERLEQLISEGSIL